MTSDKMLERVYGVRKYKLFICTIAIKYKLQWVEYDLPCRVFCGRTPPAVATIFTSGTQASVASDDPECPMIGSTIVEPLYMLKRMSKSLSPASRQTSVELG